MSKAIRCDMCERCFDPYKVEGEFMTIPELYAQDSKAYKNDEVIYRDEGLNFCPDCTKSFNKLFERKHEKPIQLPEEEQYFATSVSSVAELLERLFGQDSQI